MNTSLPVPALSVLIVEDESAVARVMSEILSTIGATQVIVTHCEVSAMHELENGDKIGSLDLMLIDLDLTHEDATVRIIANSRRQHPEAKILLMADHPDFIKAARVNPPGFLKSYNIDGFLEKPAGMDNIVCAVEPLIGHKLHPVAA